VAGPQTAARPTSPRTTRDDDDRNFVVKYTERNWVLVTDDHGFDDKPMIVGISAPFVGSNLV
jgi:hypothetical protein